MCLCVLEGKVLIRVVIFKSHLILVFGDYKQPCAMVQKTEPIRLVMVGDISASIGRPNHPFREVKVRACSTEKPFVIVARAVLSPVVRARQRRCSPVDHDTVRLDTAKLDTARLDRQLLFWRHCPRWNYISSRFS